MCARPRSTRARRRFFGARGHHRHTGRGPARARLRNGVKELLSGSLERCCHLSGSCWRDPLARGLLADGGIDEVPNVVFPGQGPMPYADVGAALDHSVVSWPDLELDSRRLAGPIVRQRCTYRRRCAPGRWNAGANAIVVSNHGGGNSMASRRRCVVLPEVVRQSAATHRGAAGWRDSPRQRHRQGAVPGARAVLVGSRLRVRAGAAGGAGVARAIEILRSGFGSDAQAARLRISR